MHEGITRAHIHTPSHACSMHIHSPHPPSHHSHNPARVVQQQTHDIIAACVCMCICKFNVYLLFELSLVAPSAQIYLSHTCSMLKQTMTSPCTALVDVMSVLPSCVNGAGAHSDQSCWRSPFPGTILNKIDNHCWGPQGERST